jgi:hypothetical protein
VKKASPSFDVGVTFKELGRIAALDVAILAFVFVYSRIKGVT